MPKSDPLKEIDGSLTITSTAAASAGGAGFDSTQADVWLAGKTTDNLNEGSVNLYSQDITAGDGIDVSSRTVSVDVTDILGYGLTETANDIDIDLTISPTWAGLHQFNSRVGIGGAADSQFMLDVNGAIRGTYLVGAHAIQLSNVAMLCHYNARNNIANLTGHLGQAPTTESGSIIGVDGGKFGNGAVSLTEEFTNYIINPSFEVDLTGWNVNSSDSSATITRDTTKSTSGNASMLLQKNTATYFYARHDNIAVADGESLTVVAAVYAGADDVRIRLYDGSTNLATTTFTADSEWVKDSVSWTNSTGSSVNVQLRIAGITDSTDDIYIDSVSATKTAYQLPYRDGTMNGCSWADTVDASTTTVTASKLAYADQLDSTGGTLGVIWTPSDDSTAQQTAYLFDNGTLSAYFNSSDSKLYLTDNTNTISAAVTFSADDDIYVYCTWGSAGIAIYVDGALLTSGATYTAGTSGTLYIGSDTAGASIVNGELCELVITDYAITAIEVRAIYESNAPVFAETSTQEFFAAGDGGSKVWLDESGIYAEDDTGLPSFALVNIDGKSWNGETLNTRDVLLGDNSTGAANILFDASAGTIGLRYGTSDVVTIDSDGVVLDGTTGAPSTSKQIVWRRGTDLNAAITGARSTVDELSGDTTLRLASTFNGDATSAGAAAIEIMYEKIATSPFFRYHYNFYSIPTSTTGLNTGDIWSDSGTLKIV